MSLQPENKVKDWINESGYPFQFRVEAEINATANQHQFWIVAREHRWQDAQSGSENFIDLVLSNDDTTLVVECKRRTDAEWLFLIPDEVQHETMRARIEWTLSEKNVSPVFRHWNDIYVHPPSLEAMFCTMAGQKNDERAMLERVASLLIRSQEVLSQEAAKMSSSEVQARPNYFASVIVTNAKLRACRFGVEDVSIGT